MNVASQVSDTINEMLIDDCSHLFECYGCDVNYQGAIESPDRIHSLAAIDAGCDEIELTLILNIPFSILALSYPCQEMVMSIPEEQLEDWLLELANQLMGKIKNRLVEQSLNVQLGLPDACLDAMNSSEQVNLLAHSGCLFHIDNEFMECWLHIDVKDQNIVLSKTESEEAFSGEIELF